MLIRVALLLVSLPLLTHGIEGLYHAYRSRIQAPVTCEQFREERPASGWLRLTGCEIDYVRAGYRETRGRVTELFFPLRPAGSSPAQPAVLVLSTRDPELLAIIERELAGRAQSDEEAFLVMMLRIVTAMGASHEVEGQTRSSLEMLRTRRALGAIKAPLDAGFTVLDLHGRPRLIFPAIEAVLGATALLVVVFLSKAPRRARSTLTVTPAAGAASQVPAQAPVDQQSDDPRFRRLMLVNLSPQSLPSALENAPPLGPQAGVRSALSRVLPGIVFSSSGIGQFNRPDHTIRLDLGTTPDVWTATVDVTGDAAAAALKRLVTQTGWQVYAPRLGRFLSSEDLNG
ncbi:hypothetical protein BH24ACI5_BH24ACI5_17910 [soil metagenome]